MHLSVVGLFELAPWVGEEQGVEEGVFSFWEGEEDGVEQWSYMTGSSMFGTNLDFLLDEFCTTAGLTGSGVLS